MKNRKLLMMLGIMLAVVMASAALAACDGDSAGGSGSGGGAGGGGGNNVNLAGTTWKADYDSAIGGSFVYTMTFAASTLKFVVTSPDPSYPKNELNGTYTISGNSGTITINNITGPFEVDGNKLNYNGLIFTKVLD